MTYQKTLKQSKLALLSCLVIGVSTLTSCESAQKQELPQELTQTKPVIYQVFTRLFGNKKTNNKPWGTLNENGVGKFNDFTDVALTEIKALGITHVWYTGVLHLSLIHISEPTRPY